MWEMKQKEQREKERNKMAFDVYAAFREKIENQILEYLPPEYENAKIQIAPVQKNNGVTLYGLSILKPEEKICPTIYLEKYFIVVG